jgi:DNA primase
VLDVERLLVWLGIDAKRNGHERQGLCPYHQDRKPSWSIRDQPGSERHGLHGCFSCGAGGDAIQLVVDLMGFEKRSEARTWMAENGITAEPDVPIETEVIHRGSKLGRELAVPALVQFGALGTWVSAARDCAVGRGLTDEQIARWGIGYAVSGRCRGRIWIPVRDEQGTLWSWMARAYHPGALLRYLTPDREELPDGDCVFGQALWSDRSRIVVCEGALNALACERAGAANVAALGGAMRVTPLVIAALSGFDRIDILTDPDPAGESAAMQIYWALKRWREVRHLHTEPGLDANDLPEDQLRALLAG